MPDSQGSNLVLPYVFLKIHKKQQFKLPLTALGRRGCVMLQKLSDNIADCVSHAVEAQRRADAAADLESRREYADMAGKWRRLAESYQFVERIERFLDTAKTTAGVAPK